ncbi:hypothetical protein [Moorena sp. SIO3E8]|nr:hypothetical protein [Moorena sp. SIO3E8]
MIYHNTKNCSDILTTVPCSGDPLFPVPFLYQSYVHISNTNAI